MKKIAFIFGFLVLTSQLPICPLRVVPNDLVNRIEYGRQWTGLFMRAFGFGTAGAMESPRVSSDASANSGEWELKYTTPVSLASLAVPEPPAVDVDLPDPDAPITIVANMKGPVDHAALTRQIQKEMDCLRVEFRGELNQLKAHRDALQQHEIRLRTIKSLQKFEKIRVVVTTKPA